MTIKVLHAITTLEIGGAESMLLRLLQAGARDKFQPSVLSLMDPNRAQVATLVSQIAALRVTISTLGMPQGRPSPARLWRLRRIVRAAMPDLLQGWMYHGSLAATVGSWSLPRRVPVLWNVRHSVHDLALEKPLTRLIIRLSSRLSRLPQAIVYNSRVSAAQHARLGFDPSRAVVIPNGFDGTRFRPQPEARGRLRAELGIDPGRAVIGMVARAHPMKDTGNLVRAVAWLQARGHAVHLVIVGAGLDQSNDELGRLVHECGLGAQVSLLGSRTDVPALIAGFDVAALSSAWGEGFPNVLGEAMASGVPCVATDVGDCSWVIGPHGVIVPPRQSEALANALGACSISGRMPGNSSGWPGAPASSSTSRCRRWSASTRRFTCGSAHRTLRSDPGGTRWSAVCGIAGLLDPDRRPPQSSSIGRNGDSRSALGHTAHQARPLDRR